ncbi:hypothetical protein AMS68_004414 [Peltaster fructicola]|uniref:Uncharacterized protein n=1 Tax=Peltaster fructicola TaxID=286661 RepID=A0A6H0XVV9_9PEZI|nr:hypothetical protein AMS68_004414 [Peltaster fructicola]
MASPLPYFTVPLSRGIPHQKYHQVVRTLTTQSADNSIYNRDAEWDRFTTFYSAVNSSRPHLLTLDYTPVTVNETRHSLISPQEIYPTSTRAEWLGIHCHPSTIPLLQSA